MHEQFVELLEQTLSDVLPPSTLELLAGDLVDTAKELGSVDARHVLRVWLKRIGGWQNVPSYTATLVD